MTVTEPFSVFALLQSQLEYTRGEYEKQTKGYAEQTLAAVADTANSARVSCETVHVEREHVYEAIIDTATAHGCDLILMASHGRRGVSAIVLGSETVKVLTHSKSRDSSTVEAPVGPYRRWWRRPSGRREVPKPHAASHSKGSRLNTVSTPPTDEPRSPLAR